MRAIAGSILLVLAIIILQGTIIPACIADPFRPNLLLIMVVYLGLRSEHLSAAFWSYGIGLVHLINASPSL